VIPSQEGTRRVTVEVIVGALVTAVFVLIFLDIPILVKTILVTFLGIVGVLSTVQVLHYWAQVDYDSIPFTEQFLRLKS
jgi:hypothetical protein